MIIILGALQSQARAEVDPPAVFCEVCAVLFTISSDEKLGREAPEAIPLRTEASQAVCPPFMLLLWFLLRSFGLATSETVTTS